MFRFARALAAVALLALVAQAPAQGVARAHWSVSTTDPEAQAAFDRGVALLYAFSIGEARLAFRKAGSLDAKLAMAAWGEAQAESFDINLPQTGDGDRRGARAIAEARRRAAGASPAERGLIDALALRFGAGSKDERFRAFADAMTRFAARFPDDANGLTVAAYARWNATAALLTKDDAPNAGATEILRNVDRALALEPSNLGARHLRIHLLEMLRRPEQALEDARYLTALTYEPGMSHLIHMPGHIYARVGDYDGLIAANRVALANDAAFFALGDGEGQRYIKAYHDHDLEFVLYGLTTEGRDAEVRAAVAGEDETTRRWVAMRLRRNEEVIALSRDASRFWYRAVALARLGNIAEARAALAKVPAGFDEGSHAKAILEITRAIVARADGKLDVAIASYRRAVNDLAADELGDPKILWFVPPGEGYGAVLLEAKRYAEAESAFRRELRRFPNDPRLAFGLAEALRLQGKDDVEPRALMTREWKGERPLTVADLG